MTEQGSSTVHRVNVNFSEGAYRDLAALAEHRETTMAEVLRDAISLAKWFYEARARGERVLLQRAGSDEVREIVFR